MVFLSFIPGHMEMPRLLYIFDPDPVQSGKPIASSVGQEGPFFFIGKADGDSGLYVLPLFQKNAVNVLLLKFFLDQTAVAVFADAALKNRMQSQLSQTQGKKRRSASHKGLHGIHHILLSGSRQFLHPGNYQVNVHITKYICVPPLHCLLFISLFPRPLISLSSYLCLLIFVFLYFPFSVCPGCPKRLSPVHTCRSFSQLQPDVFSPAEAWHFSPSHGLTLSLLSAA